jgi:hypothetical protein
MATLLQIPPLRFPQRTNMARIRYTCVFVGVGDDGVVVVPVQRTAFHIRQFHRQKTIISIVQKGVFAAKFETFEN